MTCAQFAQTPLCGTANCTIKNCMKTGEAINGETVMKTKDGKEIPIQAACSALFDKDGKPYGGMEVIVDRTEAVTAAFRMDNILKSVGAPMFVTDADLLIESVNDPALKAMGYRREEVVGKMTCAQFAQTPLCGTANCTIKTCMRTGEIVEGETVATTRDGKKVPIAAVCSALFDKDGKPYGGMEVIVDQTEQKDTLKEVARLIQAAQNGELDERAEIGDAQGDYKALRENINVMLDAIVGPITEAAQVMAATAAKDLTKRVDGDYKGQLAQLKDNINQAVTALDDALSQVAGAVDQVAGASGQISSGSQTLAQGASEQASSLEEITSSMEEMSSQTKQNAANAEEAKSLAGGARDSAEKGSAAMERMAGALDQIKTSSDETAKIVKTIDEIAFQTNMLALNAAVEAARAGDAGKGFAVVAEEVRNLAQRSAEAARNTADMIEGAVKNADNGVGIGKEVGGILAEIVEGSRKVNDLVAEIAAASKEQTQGIEQVNTALGQMDQMTQSSAANAEESASAAEELNAQADELRQMAAEFSLSQVASAKAPSHARAAAKPAPEQQMPGGKHSSRRASIKGNKAAKKPNEVIPMDEEDEAALAKF